MFQCLLSTQSDVAAWRAQVGAIDVRANGVHVVVKNRGQKLAANVTVDVSGGCTSGRKAIKCRAGMTTTGPKAASKVAAKPVPTLEKQPAGTTFGPFTGFPNTPGVRCYLLLAEASCPDDRAISDPTTLLPCSLRPTPSTDLVVGGQQHRLVGGRGAK